MSLIIEITKYANETDCTVAFARVISTVSLSTSSVSLGGRETA